MASSMEFQLYTYITMHMQVFLIVGHNQTLKSHSLGHAIFLFWSGSPNLNGAIFYHYPLKKRKLMSTEVIFLVDQGSAVSINAPPQLHLCILISHS